MTRRPEHIELAARCGVFTSLRDLVEAAVHGGRGLLAYIARCVGARQQAIADRVMRLRERRRVGGVTRVR
jgi:hypothetical protein